MLTVKIGKKVKKFPYSKAGKKAAKVVMKKAMVKKMKKMK